MATFPDYVGFEFGSYAESFDPSIERTEMERGPPKQAVRNSRVMARIDAALLFKSKQAAADFESWYFGTIRRSGWFDMQHPRTGQAIQARFVGGDIGRLEPLDPLFETSRRVVAIEYLR